MAGKIGVEGATRTIRGDPSLARSKITLKAMMKVLRKEGGGILVEFNRLEGKEVNALDQPPFLKAVLEEYSGIFEAPRGLLPNRGNEHAIVMKEGSNPVNVRPYRNPQIQKDRDREVDQ